MSRGLEQVHSADGDQQIGAYQSLVQGPISEVGELLDFSPNAGSSSYAGV